MITPKELLEKSEKLFNKVITAILNEQNIFPLSLPANKKLSGTNFNELKAAIVPLYQHSKEVKGKGYSVEWRDKIIEGTKQKLPAKIYFETSEDFFYFTKKEKDYTNIQQSLRLLIDEFPELADWAKNNASFLLSQSESILELIKVCKYFKDNRPPHNLYLRELPIEVDSKFIENNLAALKRLLDIILPPGWFDPNAADFLDRYYIKRPNVYTQIRILDEDLKPVIGFDELALTIDDSASLSWKPQRVFIIENKACFLSFPKVKNAIAIFGEGFKSRVSKQIPWLENTDLYCWFDLDAAGFEMLNIIRQYYPDAKSFLMDEKTYNQFNQFSVSSTYRKLSLEKLDADESKLYNFLQNNSKRLEQERITNSYISLQLNSILN
ncbi:MAG: Wadjet anti-phage system protein JetD domain-containing protein [Chitinophagaceae bacterium]|jgi:hypothetical protein|nr:DUF2220 family protein [Ferruginibacter sp.]HMP20337.1 DUF2220 family protein [Ferruginibacter sp.]